VLGPTSSRASSPSRESASLHVLAGCESRDGSLEVLDTVGMGRSGSLRRSRRRRTVVRRGFDARERRAREPVLASGIPRPPRLLSPFRVFSPSQIGTGHPARCLPGVARAAFHRGCRAPPRLCSLDGVPGAPGRNAGYSLGVRPSRACTSCRPGGRFGPGCLLLRASCVVARRRRRPAPWSLALRTKRPPRAAAGPSGVCDPPSLEGLGRARSLSRPTPCFQGAGGARAFPRRRRRGIYARIRARKALFAAFLAIHSKSRDIHRLPTGNAPLVPKAVHRAVPVAARARGATLRAP
jgi:hypothetical protein